MALFAPTKVHAPSLHALLMHELQDLYDAEFQIIEALPKMINHATNMQLKEALAQHLEETRLQTTRLEDVFNIMDTSAHRGSCDGMKGIIREAEHMMNGDMDPAVKDDAIIAAAQLVEHHEIAAYGTARDLAKHLGFDDAAKLLDANLDEEGKADKILTDIAKSMRKEMAKAA